MGLYTKKDVQIDDFYEVVSTSMSLSKKIFYSKNLDLSFFVLKVIMFIQRSI